MSPVSPNPDNPPVESLEAPAGEGAGAPEHHDPAGAAGEPLPPPLSNDELLAALEAILYASPEPLSRRVLRGAFPETPPERVDRALDDLTAAYRGAGRGLQILEVAGGYQITTRPEYHERVSRLLDETKPARLSTQALETLSVIAYRQPITVPEIMELRGVRSASVVRTLLEKKFIRIVGRKNVVGRPLMYGTTKEFLLRFGLKDLGELPRTQELKDLFGEDSLELERSAGEASGEATPDSLEREGSASADATEAEPGPGPSEELGPNARDVRSGAATVEPTVPGGSGSPAGPAADESPRDSSES